MTKQNLSLEQKQLLRDIYAHAVHLMRQGVADKQIENALQYQFKEVTPKLAKSVVRDLAARRDGRSRPRPKGGMSNMVIGGAICVVGIAITLGSYEVAREGGTYVVAWGAIAFGGLQFLYGLASVLRF